jgi:methionyl-tRNA synthetase
VSLIARNCGGMLPAPGVRTSDDSVLLDAADGMLARMRAAIDRQALNEALEEVWKVIRAANSYIDRQAPWALKKTDEARMAAVLRVLADALRVVATVLQPYMPASMGAMLDQVGVPAEARDFAALTTTLGDGVMLPAPKGVFPRYIEETA